MENRSFFFPASIFSFDQSQDVGILDTKMYAPNGKKDGIQISDFTGIGRGSERRIF